MKRFKFSQFSSFWKMISSNVSLVHDADDMLENQHEFIMLKILIKSAQR